ncbi:MAG: galactokinase [Anaerolineae bacterium]|nr:galactokinase [Anaerolineae bacterium]
MNTSQQIDAFKQQFGVAPTFVARAPGRVNLIGEHTDYNDGFVLPMAIDRDVTLVGAPRTDAQVRIHSLNFEQTTEFSLSDIQKTGPEWSHYGRGVALALQKAGYVLTGFDAVMYGNVPIASGLSSSAATELATIMAFSAAAENGKLKIENGELSLVSAAKLAQQAENQFVGVNCGIMDQFISALGAAGHALMIDCRSLGYELVPMPPGATVLVVDTTAPRTLAGSAYNQRRAECEAGAVFFDKPSLRDVTMAEFKALQPRLPTVVMHRCAHVIMENRRVLDAVAAMKAGDLEQLGILMSQSHESLRDLYEVSSKELDAVVEIARAEEGVYGARMTGAGFGGCAIVLVANEHAAAVAAKIADEYPRRTGRTPNIYPCVASAGAGHWKLGE